MKIGGLEFEDCRFDIKTKEGGGFETPDFMVAKNRGELKVCTIYGFFSCRYVCIYMILY